MSTETADNSNETAERGPERPDDRYAQLRLGTDEFVIYDREDHAAWIESTVALSLDAYR